MKYSRIKSLPHKAAINAAEGKTLLLNGDMQVVCFEYIDQRLPGDRFRQDLLEFDRLCLLYTSDAADE